MLRVLRAPDAAQRAVLHGVVRCRAGAVTNAGVWYDPGSAERHEECRTASGTRILSLRSLAGIDFGVVALGVPFVDHVVDLLDVALGIELQLADHGIPGAGLD